MILRTNSSDNDFVNLVKLLDIELKKRDGEDHSFFAQFNKIDNIHHVLVLYQNKIAIGCGAIKEYEIGTMEIKRMFVLPQYRSNGFATQILTELVSWAKELGYKKCILETGYKQPEAIALYKKNDFEVIPNYGQYANVTSSVCFQKVL